MALFASACSPIHCSRGDNCMLTVVLLRLTPEFILTTYFSGNTVGPASTEGNDSLWPYFIVLSNLAEQVESILTLNK